nr:AAA family ATPase [Pullulanibacillus pueri]
MDHFRQYYGHQSIQFASSEGEQIVTVILGENGRGKTGIYRAMMLAFFGDTKLEQDSQEAEIILTNIKALEEQTQGVQSGVTVIFEHLQQTYRLRRTYFAQKTEDGVIHEQLLKVSLDNVTTNESWQKEQEVQAMIRKIVDERVKHYFFFDGERIERLTRVSSQQREEIAIGIKNLLKIDHVMKSKEVINKVLSKVKKELEQHSKGEYKKALIELTQKEQSMEKLAEQQETILKEKNANQDRILSIDEQLKEYESMKALFLERETLEKEEDRLKQALMSKMEQLKKMNKYLPLLLGEDTYHATLAKLRGDINLSNTSGIESDFINQLMEDMRCICGASVPKESPEYQQLAALKASVEAYEENKTFHDLYQSLQGLISYLEGRQDSVAFILNEVKQIQGDQEEVKWKLEELNRNLSAVGEQKIYTLNQERTELTQAMIQLEVKLTQIAQEQADLKSDIDHLEMNVQELKRKSGIRDQLLQKHDILRRAVASLTSLIATFERELMQELEMTTQQNLQYLLDDAGRAMMKKVKINPDYSIEILNAYNQPFLANISQGQRQVLSLSFITALAQVAGGKTSLEMPLLMDTPFGRLSSVHQQGLLEYLPKICSQWVLLVTDREYGPEEQALFRQSNAIGRSYRLTSTEPGVTLIEEVNSQALVKG